MNRIRQMLRTGKLAARFWSHQQAYFAALCVACKVERVVQLTKYEEIINNSNWNSDRVIAMQEGDSRTTTFEESCCDWPTAHRGNGLQQVAASRNRGTNLGFNVNCLKDFIYYADAYTFACK